MNILDFGYYYLLRPFFAAVFSSYKLEIIGKENIPQGIGLILAINHSNFLDGPLTAWGLRPRIVHWVVSKDIYSRWYFKPFCIASRSVPVNGSTRLVEEFLNKGKVIGIFPQGGVNREKFISGGHKGVAVLARRTGVPIVPCYIEAVLHPTRRLNIAPVAFTLLKLTFGKPLYFEKHPSDVIPDDILNDTLRKIITAINDLASSSQQQ